MRKKKEKKVAALQLWKKREHEIIAFRKGSHGIKLANKRPFEKKKKMHKAL